MQMPNHCLAVTVSFRKMPAAPAVTNGCKEEIKAAVPSGTQKSTALTPNTKYPNIAKMPMNIWIPIDGQLKIFNIGISTNGNSKKDVKENLRNKIKNTKDVFEASFAPINPELQQIISSNSSIYIYLIFL